MPSQIAELQRQLDEERNARLDAERRRDEAEQQVRGTTLTELLEKCHTKLAQTLLVQGDAALTTEGNPANPVGRLYPKRLVPWANFPSLQKSMWQKLKATDFTSRPVFPSDTQLDFVSNNVRNKPIDSEASLRSFQKDTVDNFVELIIKQLQNDDSCRRKFGIKGPVSFYDHANLTEPSQDKSFAQTQQPAKRRRNRRADQFCVQLIAEEQRKPVYAVEFKAPHKVTIPELVTGLQPVDMDRDVIGKEGDTFEFNATLLVAAVLSQLFSYMVDIGVQYGYVCTGEASVFLNIPNDPTIAKYSLCVPSQDVQNESQQSLQWMAIGQVLAFTLRALAAKAPSQEWHNAAHEKLSTWEVEYLDILKRIPETVRRDPPASTYRPSHRQPKPKLKDRKSVV